MATPPQGIAGGRALSVLSTLTLMTGRIRNLTLACYVRAAASKRRCTPTRKTGVYAALSVKSVSLIVLIDD